MSARYLTTTLPYVNAEPHLGFALEIVQADALVRFWKLCGDEVFFNTGTDEHGLKIYRRALEEGKDPQQYTDEYAAKFRKLKDKLNLAPDLHFIRTTDPDHKEAAQEFWRRCRANGDIYKKNYRVKYCVGCELEKTESELINGRCPIHPNLEPELIDEENYFFRWSKYQQPLLIFYEAHPDFIVPEFRFGEIKKFVERGLDDFSISRLKSKMPWGVDVPDDPDHVMYVWFDALVNYISTLGWPEDTEQFERFWGTKESPKAIQVAGKDNLRQQTAMWQAMLMSAGLPPSRQVMIHGFFTSGGQKMSKSLGNVIDPVAIVDEYGADALRFYLLRHAHPFEDGDFTMERFKETYNADLANGLGNLAARIMKMAQEYLGKPVAVDDHGYTFTGYLAEKMGEYRYDLALGHIWSKISDLDNEITLKKPFHVIKEDVTQGKELIIHMVLDLYRIGCMLQPFMPATSHTIIECTRSNKRPDNLFPRT